MVQVPPVGLVSTQSIEVIRLVKKANEHESKSKSTAKYVNEAAC